MAQCKQFYSPLSSISPLNNKYGIKYLNSPPESAGRETMKGAISYAYGLSQFCILLNPLFFLFFFFLFPFLFSSGSPLLLFLSPTFSASLTPSLSFFCFFSVWLIPSPSLFRFLLLPLQYFLPVPSLYHVNYLELKKKIEGPHALYFNSLKTWEKMIVWGPHVPHYNFFFDFFFDFFYLFFTFLVSFFLFFFIFYIFLRFFFHINLFFCSFIFIFYFFNKL